MTYAKAYHHSGHATVVSSGDYGFTAANFPANLATVTTVGGTELARAGNQRGWREIVWNRDGASGSGCSAYVAKPSWASIDRKITDEAPWVPLYNPRAMVVLSTRVGNYQFHPLWELLIDQLWVR